MIFIKINDFLNKIGPIRAHMDPYGPIRVHMGPYGSQPGPGPNPDWAPTRARAPGGPVEPSGAKPGLGTSRTRKYCN